MAVSIKLRGKYSWCVLALLTCSLLFIAECLSIVEHLVEPPVVANCSAVTFTCRVDTGAPDVEVWWTFRGENASKLPDVTIISDMADDGEWKLELKCATLEHKGSYACNAQGKNESEVVYRKEAILKIYVPLTIDVAENISSELVGKKVNLTCQVRSYPLASVEWLKGAETINSTMEQSEVATKELDSATVVSVLSLYDLQRPDNGTYTCAASNDFNNATAVQDLLVLEPPEVEFLVDNTTVEDPTSATVRWQVPFDGNLPILRFRLQRENVIEPERSPVDDNITANTTKYTIQSLLPGLAYTFYLSAENEAGVSSWNSINVSMPADVPPKVSWVHVLSSTNETLLFGWRRPLHDNGANISHYTVQLTHLNILFANKTMDIQSPGRNNLMYIFVSLDPGETYSFRVQACNALGCGNWSESLEGTTSDGTPDPPNAVEVRCEHDYEKDSDFIIVTWDVPDNARGTILSYNVTLFGRAKFRNDNGQEVEEKTAKIELVDVKTNKLEYVSAILPNTEYTVQMCTVNRGGCGPMTSVMANTQCMSVSNVPLSLPVSQMVCMNITADCRQLKLKLQRVSERNGLIQCYRVIIIQLPRGQDVSILPSEPSSLNLSSYDQVHEMNGFGAYVAESFKSEEFVKEIIIGDNQHRYCDSNVSSNERRHVSYDNPAFIEMNKYDNIQDGILSPSTNYTGFIEVYVRGSNGTVLTKSSGYFAPIQTGSLPSPEPKESPFAVIFGVLLGIILIIVLFILTLILLRHKQGHQFSENGEHLGLTAVILRTIHRNEHLTRNKGGPALKVPKLVPISPEELPAAFVERHADSDFLFQSEFEALPETFNDRTSYASHAPENLCKNRYPDIKAFDQTRVRLPLVDDIQGSDYINANFVQGYKGRKTFICAQGPLDQTVTDFWRMLWEHKVTVVVMLTGIEEHGQVKCAQYWNDDGSKKIDTLFTVSVINKNIFSDYVVRRFQVEAVKDGLTEEREILHFHFTLWKDFLAPEQPSWLLRFIKRVNEHYCSDRGPLVVHCSAGVGRTGTFVAIDSLLQQMDDEGHVDVFSLISTLRHQRNFLVQSLKQYIFVYRALMEHSQFGDTELEIRHLRDHYEIMKEKMMESEKSSLAFEFEKLGEVIEDPKTCCVGTMDMNMSKNRYDFIIPYDLNRVILPLSPSRDHSSYVNASFIQGYDRALSFIITQDPLESTSIEFWRMIKEHDITTLVMLSEIGEGQTRCLQYWPNEGEEKECDYVKVKLESSEQCPYYVKRCFTITNTKNEDNHKLFHFQFLGWPGSSGTVPERTVGLITLIEDVQASQEEHSATGPVTVHCSGGGDRSSVFVTLSVLIQQLKAEERVDIFQAARYTRSQRHCMLQTLAQYDFLYRGLLEYIVIKNLCDRGDTQL